jgi:hypothetical protein
MPGQAEQAPESMDDLAGFLMEHPEVDSDEPEAETAPEDDAEGAPDAADADDDEADDDENDDDADEPEAKQPSGDLKFKVTIKGEDGSDQTVEIDQKELVAGYQRQADYTRKTQEVANREREALQVVEQRLTEGRQHYMQQSQLALAAVQRIAGLRSPEEMAVLAQTDPAAWVQEQQREQAIKGVMAQLQEGMQREQAQAQQLTQQEAQKQISQAWEVLGPKGIDKPKLKSIYDRIHKEYGVPNERLAAITDPALVLILRDAAQLKDLQQKKAQVTKQVKEAPRLPAKRQNAPPQAKANKQLDTKFRSGRASVRDLAAFIELNS